MRRVGIEIEFGGVTAERAAELVRDLFGGQIDAIDPHRFEVHDTQFGSFDVELDWQYAHFVTLPKGVEPTLVDELALEVGALVGAVGSTLFPVEISAPPVPIDRIEELDAMIEGLRSLGATGADTMLHAFGLHYNPEVAAFEAEYILSHLRAELLLSEWLRAEIGIPFSRRVSQFVAPFPETYYQTVLDPVYRPDLAVLIDDYLRENPTRNRELDMLPLFAHIDPDRVWAAINDKLTTARPTFHYRLPTSRVDQPDWSLGSEWNRWIAVERLAADEAALADAMQAWAEHRQGSLLGSWVDIARRWAQA